MASDHPAGPEMVGEMPTMVPRFLESPPWLILHLFSGQRRLHDLQDCIEQLTRRSGFPVICMSVDITLDVDKCDLTAAAAVGFWRRAILAGRVLAVVAGPPCATWSAARFLELLEGGPRPVRSCDQPWGIDNLVTKERQAVELGSQLLRAAIQLVTKLKHW